MSYDDDPHPVPRWYQGVMVSGTFTDLEQHRAALIKAIKGHGLTDVAMENDSAKPDADVIASSLQMVRDASAYIGVISLKYGQTPVCPDRNPGKLSITELEFNEAQRLDRPILLFIMGDDHPVRGADVEANPSKRKKLRAFRERAKQMSPDSQVHRVYAMFDSLDEFKEKAGQAVAGLRRYLDRIGPSSTQPQPSAATTAPSCKPDPIPEAPAFYAEPPYIGSHKFLGRQAQLDVLDDWAEPADPHPVLLFDAIGGSGKSMLTWEWTTQHAMRMRSDWAGRFWYSFYERGAVMADFCQRALAYFTGTPLADLSKKKTPELAPLLIHHLQARPWLVVLDGLERVLVAYHRIDAAELPDEEANQPTDQMASRDPCSAMRPEDDDLLRLLAAAAPSKLLITSRLAPRVLLNQASQPIPGVLRVALPGLRPADAEALLRSCGVTGTSQAMQDYIKSHCDCHPLVTGILAGLIINDYLPDKGNFDAWAADPAGGGQLNLANLDLIQKRNHILKAALDALPEKSRQLLSTLALLSESVDYDTLSAFNPHVNPEPEEVEEPEDLQNFPWWGVGSTESKEDLQQEYQMALQRRRDYEEATKAWRQSPEYLAASQALANTVRDLERRGLLQYDPQTRRHDLHPVVRGIAAGGLVPEDKDHYGQRVVDHFTQLAHRPYDEAETLEDLRGGLQIVRTLLKMGRYKQAAATYRSGLGGALYTNLEAHTEILSLLRPLFPYGWSVLPNELEETDGAYLVNCAGNSLGTLGEDEHADLCFENALLSFVQLKDWRNAIINLLAKAVLANQLSLRERSLKLAIEFSTIAKLDELFLCRIRWYGLLCVLGRSREAGEIWRIITGSKKKEYNIYSIDGHPEWAHSRGLFFLGYLSEETLAGAEQLAKAGKNRRVIRFLQGLCGEWWLEQGNWGRATDYLHEAVHMARAAGITDESAETQLALAKFHLQQLTDPQRDAEQLANARHVSHIDLAGLWLAIGDREQAKYHALAAYRKAWGDGEPYVHRYYLNRARALLEKLGADVPKLQPYDPDRDKKLPWENAVAAAIAELRAKKEAKTRKEN